MVHSERDRATRVISFRRASREEREVYDEENRGRTPIKENPKIGDVPLLRPPDYAQAASD